MVLSCATLFTASFFNSEESRHAVAMWCHLRWDLIGVQGKAAGCHGLFGDQPQRWVLAARLNAMVIIACKAQALQATTYQSHKV